MNLYSSLPSSSTTSTSSFTLLAPIQNVTVSAKPTFKLPTRTTPSSSTSSSSNQTSQVLERAPLRKDPTNDPPETDPLEGVTLVPRPVLDIPGEDDNEEEEEEEKWERKASTVIIDAGLEEFAKKMPMFEPRRASRPSSSSVEKPLLVNLDLALYKAKILGRSFKFKEAQDMLEKCIRYWPEDGRAYVALGKILCKQSRVAEARAVYEKGCQATEAENPYIWQCWAVLENKMGNIRRARELFDAATVADKGHRAAWHGWAVLELKQGNVKKARQLLAKGVKFCGGNEYIYQTLALLEAKANRYEQACFLFQQATKCNPSSCASWLAWAQLEMQKENNSAARKLFEKAIVASPKNRFAWHVWGLFEANAGNICKARKLLKIGHALNPRDPVLLQSLALLEYKHSSANFARALFRKASELDPRHQPVWIAWGWMEWKEGNLPRARELYERALSIDSTSESAARCLQAWGVLEQRIGNLSAARRLFRSSLNINSQSYVTWMTWARLEEDQGNSVRAEEVRNLYFQQRTEVVDDPSWVAGFLDVIDPAIDSIKRVMNLDQNPFKQEQDTLKNLLGLNNQTMADDNSTLSGNSEGNVINPKRELDLDSFVKERLSLDPTKLDIDLVTSNISAPRRARLSRRIWRSKTGNNPR